MKAEFGICRADTRSIKLLIILEIVVKQLFSSCPSLHLGDSSIVSKLIFELLLFTQ